MENYEVVKQLGGGAQGSAYLVENKLTSQQYVLKKVECSDETEASKAFREAVALQSLKHPYISGYREFFVVWDKEEHAIFVCIVMDYYKLGDLETALKQRRSKNEFLEELVLKKWIGQIIEALVYVHDQHMIHRDLKPSNIFLKDDQSIAIGDFGVATVMGSIRTTTRTAVGPMSWMAPEILETTAHYDERTDVWSLGCILLAMATCGFVDSAQISGILFQLKDDPQMLEEVLGTVAEHYSPELCQLIRTTLRRAFHQRPTCRQLLELSVVQQCLRLSNSPLYREPTEGGGSSEDVKPVPKDGGSEAVIAYMEENSKNAACQTAALQCLLGMMENQLMSDSGKKRVLQTMRDLGSSVQVQILACQMLTSLAISASEGDMLFTKEFIYPVCLAMRSHAGSIELQSSACALIMALSSDVNNTRLRQSEWLPGAERTSVVLGEVGVIQDILAAMRSFPADLEVTSSCCTALWSLSVIEANMAVITKERGVRDICSALATHSDCRDLVDAACSALWSLSMEDDNLNLMADLEVVELLLKSLEKHIQDPGVAKFSCAALSSLAEVHDISAFSILHTENGVDGVPIILKALNTHCDNGEVVESISLLFQELANYEEIKQELTSLKVGSVLRKLQGRVPQSEGIEHDANAAINGALTVLEEKPSRLTSAREPNPTDQTKAN